jgi:hypothetical protein
MSLLDLFRNRKNPTPEEFAVQQAAPPPPETGALKDAVLHEVLKNTSMMKQLEAEVVEEFRRRRREAAAALQRFDAEYQPLIEGDVRHREKGTWRLICEGAPAYLSGCREITEERQKLVGELRRLPAPAVTAFQERLRDLEGIWEGIPPKYRRQAAQMHVLNAIRDARTECRRLLGCASPEDELPQLETKVAAAVQEGHRLIKEQDKNAERLLGEGFLESVSRWAPPATSGRLFSRKKERAL